MNDILTRTLTTCPYCGVGCGICASETAKGVTVAGDSTHPANFGRLCVKGSALAQTLARLSQIGHAQVELVIGAP